MKHLNYEARCNYFNLSSLKMRRLRGDLIQKFKFENNIESINWYVKPKSTPPRSSHRSYFIRELVKNCRERSHFFNNRIANQWNSLPDNIVNSPNVNTFKSELDKYLVDDTVISS